MPGIVGTAELSSARRSAPSARSDRGEVPGGEPTDETDDQLLRQMQGLITHRDDDSRGPIGGTRRVHGASSLHFPPPDPVESNEYHGEHLHVWLDGELLRSGRAIDRHGLDGRPRQAELLARLYQSADDWAFLSRLDGLFAAVVCDLRRKRLHLMCDHWGLKYLYWTRMGDTLAWASEVKAFLGHPDFDPVIDRQAVDHFFCSGQLYGQESWFETAQLVPPGSVLTWELQTGRRSRTRYWHWSQREVYSAIDEQTAARRMHQLLTDAVRARCREEVTYGMGISGGLDSRALLAVLPDEIRDGCQTFTYGDPNCRDIDVAERVARRADVSHHTYPINERNWFDRRIQGVWLTDGEWSLQHMHSCVCIGDFPEMFDIHLSGSLGGGFAGGVYMDWEGSDLGRRRLEEVVATRGRRLINQERRFHEMVTHERNPYLDCQLIDFILSLPRELLSDGRTFHRMLLEEHPEYFRNIPYANTGVPIGSSELYRRAMQLGEAVANAVRSLTDLFGEPREELYVNYHRWFGGPSYREVHTSILFEPPMLYREYLPDLPLREIWEAYRADRDIGKWKVLSRALTFEIWLEQVFGELER